MQSIAGHTQQVFHDLLLGLGWLTGPLLAVAAILLSLNAFVILTSMTLPTGSRRPYRRRARLHIGLLTSVSSLGAWATLALSGIATWELLKLLSTGPTEAWRGFRDHGAGQIEISMLLAAVVIALASRWHRESIAGTSHFTLQHVLRCQAIRMGFLAAPLCLLTFSLSV